MLKLFFNNMRNFKTLIIIFLFITFSSCNKKLQKEKISIIAQTTKKDSFVLIRDTTIFANSSEGEKLSLFKNKKTNDSIIKSIVYGETGKIEYTFIFNKRLLKGNRVIFNYEEPIYVNPTPKINKKIVENLNTSPLIKKELANVFLEDANFFRNQKLYIGLNKMDLILEKWEGIYYLSPYSVDSGRIGSYYIEIFKSRAHFGFSGNDEFNMEVELNEEGNKLYLFDKTKKNNQPELEKDTLAVLSEIDNKTFVKSKMIKILRNDVKQNIYGYMFNWKKTVEEVPDAPE